MNFRPSELTPRRTCAEATVADTGKRARKIQAETEIVFFITHPRVRGFRDSETQLKTAYDWVYLSGRGERREDPHPRLPLHRNGGEGWGEGERGLPGQLLADRLFHGRQGRGEVLGLLAAGLGEVGPAAATAAHDGRQALDQLARLDPRRQVLGDRGHQADVALRARADHHHAGAELGAQRVRHVPHLVGRSRRHLSGQDPDAVDHLLLVGGYGGARDELHAELAHLLLQLVLALADLLRAQELLLVV